MSRQGIFAGALAGIILVGGLLGSGSFQAWAKETAKTAAAKNGKITGICTAKTDKEITVKAEGTQKLQRYRLNAPSSGAQSAEFQKALKMVFPTNLVVLQWQGEQDPVLTSIQAMHAKTRFGTVTGIVTAVEPAPKGALPCFDLKPISRGPTERYAPNWDFAAKSFDKNFTRALAAMNVGDKVKVNWNYDERKRAAQIQVLSRAKAKPAEKTEKPEQTP